jgi:hypothetical protein
VHSDQLWSECHHEFQHLSFVGAESPISKEDWQQYDFDFDSNSVLHLARALFAIRQLERKIASPEIYE